MFEFDELKVYRGSDIKISSDIIVTQPTLGQIEEFGEKKYFNAVYTLTATGADLKYQLWDMAGIDYTTIEDYDLFIGFISKLVSSRKAIYKEIMDNDDEYKSQITAISKEDFDDMLVNPLQLVLKDIDLADFTPCTLKDNGNIILYNPERDITIDRIAYVQIVDAVRKIHGLKRNNEKPGNEATKMALIEDARNDARAAVNKPYRSVLKPLVSALSVKCGMCGNDNIWNMPVSALFDDIKRAYSVQEAEALLSGAYSGFASLKGVDKSRLDWTRSL